MKRLMVIGLALAALSGCDASPDAMGFQDATGGAGDQRGDVDAGGAGGAGAGGASGSGGGTAAAGGHNGAGGAPAATGGSAGSLGSMGGAPGSSAGGAGGNSATYLPCTVYSWSPNGGTGCVQQTSPGVFLNGYKDGHQCIVCRNPTRPTGVPDCQDPAGPDICVISCDECTFQ